MNPTLAAFIYLSNILLTGKVYRVYGSVVPIAFNPLLVSGKTNKQTSNKRGDIGNKVVSTRVGMSARVPRGTSEGVACTLTCRSRAGLGWCAIYV